MPSGGKGNLAPGFILHVSSDYRVPQEVRERIQSEISRDFADADFLEMSTAMAACVGIFQNVRDAPRQAEVIAGLVATADMALALAKRLSPTIGLKADEPPPPRSARYVADRIRLGLKDNDDALHRDSAEPHVKASRVPRLLVDLSRLEQFARTEADAVQDLETLPQGRPRDTHLDGLFVELNRICERRGLTSSSVEDGQKTIYNLHIIADLARLLAPLLPKECRAPGSWIGSVSRWRKNAADGR